MAPRKEKTEKTGADQGTSMVLEYLKKQNRPYSAIDISANLHNKVTKTYTVKLLKELHEQNLIVGKAAGWNFYLNAQDHGLSSLIGKQLVYHAIQDENDNASPEDLAAMDQEITRLREEIASAKNVEKGLKATLSTLNATISTEDIRSDIGLLEARKNEILARIEPLRSGNTKPVSPKERAEVDHAWKTWNHQAGLRKKICMEIWACATEELPEGKTKEELWEERGLEDDS